MNITTMYINIKICYLDSYTKPIYYYKFYSIKFIYWAKTIILNSKNIVGNCLTVSTVFIFQYNLMKNKAIQRLNVLRLNIWEFYETTTQYVTGLIL